MCVVFCFSGCTNTKNKQLSKEDAVSIVDEILPNAMEVYNIFYVGLPTEFDVASSETIMPITEENKKYSPVISDKYKSIDDIKNFTESVFTAQFAEENFYSYFEKPVNNDVNEELSIPLYKDINGVLCENVNFGGKGWGVEWLTETLEIVEQTDETMILEMETTLFDEPNGKNRLILNKVNGLWLLSSHVV